MASCLLLILLPLTARASLLRFGKDATVYLQQDMETVAKIESALLMQRVESLLAAGKLQDPKKTIGSRPGSAAASLCPLVLKYSCAYSLFTTGVAARECLFVEGAEVRDFPDCVWTAFRSWWWRCGDCVDNFLCNPPIEITDPEEVVDESILGLLTSAFTVQENDVEEDTKNIAESRSMFGLFKEDVIEKMNVLSEPEPEPEKPIENNRDNDKDTINDGIKDEENNKEDDKADEVDDDKDNGDKVDEDGEYGDDDDSSVSHSTTTSVTPSASKSHTKTITTTTSSLTRNNITLKSTATTTSTRTTTIASSTTTNATNTDPTTILDTTVTPSKMPTTISATTTILTSTDTEAPTSTSKTTIPSETEMTTLKTATKITSTSSTNTMGTSKTTTNISATSMNTTLLSTPSTVSYNSTVSTEGLDLKASSSSNQEGNLSESSTQSFAEPSSESESTDTASEITATPLNFRHPRYSLQEFVNAFKWK